MPHIPFLTGSGFFPGNTGYDRIEKFAIQRHLDSFVRAQPSDTVSDNAGFGVQNIKLYCPQKPQTAPVRKEN